ncbi:hypothetical protein FB463_002090 [Frigoribacterium faeni]|uniref:Uncharacterized protein n=1 Tax=Frigoribacterium faeni TaxID=145483 RepID=A0A7W3JJD3_9MICO|nr:hypothetical protein [Frigoribacterium faeni]
MRLAPVPRGMRADRARPSRAVRGSRRPLSCCARLALPRALRTTSRLVVPRPFRTAAAASAREIRDETSGARRPRAGPCAPSRAITHRNVIAPARTPPRGPLRQALPCPALPGPALAYPALPYPAQPSPAQPSPAQPSPRDPRHRAARPIASYYASKRNSPATNDTPDVPSALPCPALPACLPALPGPAREIRGTGPHVPSQAITRQNVIAPRRTPPPTSPPRGSPPEVRPTTPGGSIADCYA